MKKLIPIVFIASFLFTSCLSDLFNNQEEKRINSLPRELTANEQQIIEADKDFGIDLFRNLTQNEDSNMFISPLSVSLALGMTVNGAAGDTRDGMKEALRKAGLDMQQINEAYRGLIDLLVNLDPAVKMKIGNAIWHREEIELKDPFKEKARAYFNAEVRGLDFNDPNTVDTINRWVDNQTEGLIKEIIKPPISSKIVTYLMNAIYFKGDWFIPFNPKNTRPGIFTTPDKEVEVDMMKLEKEKLAFHKSKEVQVVDLTYGDSLYSMTMIMPGDSQQPLDSFIEDKFTRKNIDRWIGELDTPYPITLEMPKFELEYKVKLNRVLAAMGMDKAFTTAADFTNMYKDGNAFIEKVDHKTAIKVDEKGTEAAAVTNVVMAISGAPEIEFNRPFIYIIRERLSGTLLFMGKMMDPTTN